MKNNFLLSFLLISFSLINILGQKKSDTPKMLYFLGGKFNLNYSQGLSTSVGTGSGSGIFGGMISPNLNFGSPTIFSNPAELAYLKKGNIFFETRLGIGITDAISQGDLKKQLDNTLKDTSTFIFTPGNLRRDTEIGSQEVSQAGGITALTGAIPFENYFVLGGGFSTPIDFSFDMLVNGISTDLASTKKVGDNETKIDIILKPTILIITQLKVNRVSYGLAREIFNDKGSLAVGLSINRYDVRQKINFNMDIGGMVVLNNLNEYYFNDTKDQNIDPNKNESNSLYLRAKGDYKDNKTGFTIGSNYNPASLNNWLSRFNFSLVFNYLPNFNVSDEGAYIQSYQPRFMKGRYSGKGDEKFDIIIDSLDLSKPNLTKPTSNYFTNEVIIKMPSSLTLGIDTKVLGVHNISLNLMKYFGEMSYQFDKYKIGKELSFGFKVGGDLKFPDELKGWAWALIPLRLLALDIDGLLCQAFRKYTNYENPHFRAFGGLNFGNAIVQGFDDKENEKSFKELMDLPLPAEIAFARTYTIFKNINIGVFIFGIPDLFLRFSFGYNI